MEASLGDKLPSAAASTDPKPTQQSPKPQSPTSEATTQLEVDADSVPTAAKFYPSGFFGACVVIQYRYLSTYRPAVAAVLITLAALKHPESPGFVVKEGFLGRQKALAVRDALTELAQSETFHEAKVGSGENMRNDRAVRGDKIHWIQTPRDLNASTDDEEIVTLSSAILHLRRQVESLVYGLKKVSPEMDLRNVVSTQFAIFVRGSFKENRGALC